MRILKPFLYSLLLFAFVFQSCSIEKRRYTNGYSLQWKKNSPTTKTEDLAKIKQQPKKAGVSPAIEKTSTPSFKTINALTASSEKKKGIVLLNSDSLKCDTLIMRDETEIKVKVIEITPTEVKYKYCDNVAGPTYVSYRYEISYIKYANGSLDSFKGEFAPVRKPIQNKQRGATGYMDNGDKVERYVRKMSVTSLFFGGFSLIPIYGLPAAVIAIIFSLICLSKINKDPSLVPYKSRTITALALGVLGLIITIGVFVLLAFP
ncbi:MAG TPA: hypothetical protein VK835_12535 [Bacteroidia bacterium]|jgi:hypothetical protein|nr:hypothetical protein [Bacteroidia bacterium]